MAEKVQQSLPDLKVPSLNTIISIFREWLRVMILFSTLREHFVNRNDLQALTLLGPPRDNPEPDPLTELHLNNQLSIR